MFFLSPDWFRWWFSVVPLKGHFLVANDEIAVINDLGSDVHPVFNLEVDEVRLSVFDFVESRFLWSGTLDIGKRLVVIDHREEERLASGFLIQLIVESELLLVISFVFVHLLGYPRFGGMDLPVSLSVKCL